LRRLGAGFFEDDVDDDEEEEEPLAGSTMALWLGVFVVGGLGRPGSFLARFLHFLLLSYLTITSSTVVRFT
jgi:hypothetical protein